MRASAVYDIIILRRSLESKTLAEASSFDIRLVLLIGYGVRLPCSPPRSENSVERQGFLIMLIPLSGEARGGFFR